MAKVTITHTETLHQGHTTLKKVSFEKEKTDGSSQKQSREIFDHGNAATVLLYNKEAGTVLLTRQLRIATLVNGNGSGMLLETPAGLLEPGEDPAATMLREIEEETGYKIPKVEKIFEAYSSPGAYTELVHYFVGEYRHHQKTSEGGGLKEEGEDIEIREMPLQEAAALLEKGEIRDAKTIILLQYALAKRLF